MSIQIDIAHSPNTSDIVVNALMKAVRMARQIQAQNQLPIVYRDNHCVKKNQFIHEYADGRKYLIEQDQKTSEEKIIKEFY